MSALVIATMNAQDRIGECWREICITAGKPDQIVPGWRMIRDLSKSRRPSFTPAAALTRPQPVLRDGRERAA